MTRPKEISSTRLQPHHQRHLNPLVLSPRPILMVSIHLANMCLLQQSRTTSSAAHHADLVPRVLPTVRQSLHVPRPAMIWTQKDALQALLLQKAPRDGFMRVVQQITRGTLGCLCEIKPNLLRWIHLGLALTSIVDDSPKPERLSKLTWRRISHNTISSA